MPSDPERRGLLGAEPGARVAADSIALSEPVIGGNAWSYVRECLDSSWVSSSGKFVDRFETETAAYLGCRHAVATNTGTAALHIALLCAGVQPGDEVLVSDLTFIAPVNAVRYVGAYPVLVDAEPDYWQMDVGAVREFFELECRADGNLLRNKRTGRRIGAVLPVHVLGHPVDIDPLVDLARAYGVPIVEDATECLGARYKGRPTGTHGDVACFSFNGNKIITAGAGGMITTNDPAIASRAKYLSTQAKDDAVEYIHHEIGYNYRLSNVHAALGVSQLEQLDEFLAAKKRIAANYKDGLGDIPGISCMPEAPWATASRWLYTILVEPNKFGVDSRALMRALAEQRIQTRPLWRPIHLNRPYVDMQRLGSNNAVGLNERALSLPCSVNLTSHQQDRTIEAIGRLYRQG